MCGLGRIRKLTVVVIAQVKMFIPFTYFDSKTLDLAESVEIV